MAAGGVSDREEVVSYAGKVRREAAGIIDTARHCRLAELAVYVATHGVVRKDCLTLEGENAQAREKAGRLAALLYGCDIPTQGAAQTAEVLCGIKIDGGRTEVAGQHMAPGRGPGDGRVSPLLLKNACCRRAYLRGMYVSAGSMSDPQKGYHLEYGCGSRAQAAQLQDILKEYGVVAHETQRKGRSVVYLKESEAIADVLNIIGAHQSLLELENLRIEKDLRSAVNRRVNCDTANIEKTLTAAQRQLEDIRYIQRMQAMRRLPEALREMAQLRLEYPEAPLGELGEMLDPPVGKSGVNHRLRRISQIAQELRESGA